MFRNLKSGFTMIEMMISLVIVSILVLVVGSVVSDSYGNWNDMYERVFGVQANNIVKVQRDFNATCRKATLRNVYLSTDKRTLIVYYFSSHINPPYWPDRYVQYYLDGTNFKVEYGELNFATLTKKNSTRTDILCDNVQYLNFAVQSLSVQLCMTTNNNGSLRTFAWAAVRHN